MFVLWMLCCLKCIAALSFLQYVVLPQRTGSSCEAGQGPAEGRTTSASSGEWSSPALQPAFYSVQLPPASGTCRPTYPGRGVERGRGVSQPPLQQTLRHLDSGSSENHCYHCGSCDLDDQGLGLVLVMSAIDGDNWQSSEE